MNAYDIERKAADWLSQRSSGVWSAEDEQRLQKWVDASLAHRIAYLRLESIWTRADRLKVLKAGATAVAVPPRNSWSADWHLSARSTEALTDPPIPEPASTEPVRRFRARRPSRWATAAVAAVVVAGAVYGFLRISSSAGAYSTNLGAVDTVSLQDGSTITLNTDSRVRVSLASDKRVVELDQGEAFFEVAKDPSRPFVVKAGDRSVVAVGTKFSVRRQGGDIRVAVTEGAVRIDEGGKLPANQRAPGSGQVLISAGAVAQTMDRELMLQQHPAVEIDQLLNWRHGYLVFRDTTLADAVAEFNRYNARKIVIEDPAIAAIRIGGNFRASNTDTFLWMLQNGFPISVETKESEVVLKAR